MDKFNNLEKRALVVSTVASTLDQFCMNDIKLLQENYKVDVAANFSVGNNTSKKRIEEFKLELNKKNIKINEISFNRSPFSKSNLLAYKEIKKLVKDNCFEIIHCHTPVAAMIVRLVAINVRKNGTKVIYTAHGFHFFKGAPIKNWIIFYPIEKVLSRFTDVIITINKEDYTRANKKLKAKKIEYIPGIGIDVNKFVGYSNNNSKKRSELGVPDDAFLLLSIGELNTNKNHESVIRALENLKDYNIYYLICGQGTLEKKLKDLISKLGLKKNVLLLGYRQDIAEISKISDAFIFPSFREGLSVALMEAMASGLPVICSKIRGNVDLIDEYKGGYLVTPNDIIGFESGIRKIVENKELKVNMGRYNKDKINEFDINKVENYIRNIYINESK